MTTIACTRCNGLGWRAPDGPKGCDRCGGTGALDYDHAKECYASLAEEATDELAHPWKDEDWDTDAVAHAKAYAADHGLPWPPGLGDFDRHYEREHDAR